MQFRRAFTVSVRPVIAVRRVWLVGPMAIAGVAVAVTLYTAWALWGAGSAVMAMAGALTVLFARDAPYRHRARTVGMFGLLIMAAAALADVASGSVWYLLIVLVVLAGVAGWATQLMRTPIPGPTMLMIPPTMIAGIPPAGDLSVLGHRIEMVAFGVTVALVTTLAPAIAQPDGPQRRAVASACRATAAVLAEIGGPRFASARTAAWAAIDQAYRGLSLSGGGYRLASDLWSIADNASHLLQTAETATTAAPRELIDGVSQLASQLHNRRPRRAAGSRRPDPREAVAELASAVARHPWPARPAAAEPPGAKRQARAPYRHAPVALLAGTTATRDMILRLMAVTAACGAVAIGLGLARWYWAPVCAAAVLQGSHSTLTWQRAAQRILGTVAGSAAGACLLALHVAFPVTAAIVIVLFMLGELHFPANYGLGIVFVTPMLYLMICGASPVAVNAAALLDSRVATNALGAIMSVIIVLTVLPASSSRLLRAHLAASLRLQQRIAETAPTAHPAKLAQLRHLERADLASLTRLAAEASGEARGRTRDRRLAQASETVRSAGYRQLAKLAAAPLDTRLGTAYWAAAPAGATPGTKAPTEPGLRKPRNSHSPRSEGTSRDNAAERTPTSPVDRG